MSDRFLEFMSMQESTLHLKNTKFEKWLQLTIYASNAYIGIWGDTANDYSLSGASS